jgi:predicted Zn finger-like uncharacterized protein
MQTQCPHCATRFRVTETQVNIADGLVRCGVCKEVFNALEVASQNDYQPSLLDNDVEAEQVIEFDAIQEVQAGTHLAADDFKITEDGEIRDEIESQPTAGSDIALTEQSGKDTFDFFDENVNQSLTYVVPEKFRDTYAGQSHSAISTLLWSIGILSLIATLLVEYVWFNRDQFSHVPELQAWIEKICQQVECKNIAVRDPSKIELVSRNVYSHPAEKNALMVNVVMKNNADFAQAYPIMQIEFSDVRGGRVAARRFRPAEYLPAESMSAGVEQPRLLLPNTSSSITMEILDPGKQAMTYEFNFL